MAIQDFLAGNFLAFAVIASGSLWMLLAIFAPFNKAVGKALSSAIPCIGSLCACFCGFFGPWLQPLTTIMLLIYTVAMLIFNPLPIAIVLAIIGIFVGVFGVLLKKLPPHELEIMGIPFASRKYNSFWMVLFSIGMIFYTMFLFPIGAIFGFIFLILLVVGVIAGIVLIAVFAPEVVAPMAAELGVGGAAAGMAGVEGVAAGGEMMGGGEFAGMAEQGAGALRGMGAAGKGMGGMGGMPGIGAEEQSMVQEVKGVQQNIVNEAEGALAAQRTASQTEIASAQSELKEAQKAKDPQLEQTARQRLNSAQQRFQESGERSQKLFGSLQDSTEDSEGGRFGRHFDSSGKMATWEILILGILVFFFVIVVAAYVIPENTPAYNGVKFLFDGIKFGVDAIWRGILNFGDWLISWLGSQFTPCEIGATGVPCKILQQRSCEPFCISPSGREAPWKGFEIKKLEVVPATIFDYQKFSILSEFANEGSGDSTFATVGEPTFGFFQAGGKLRCEWGLGGIIFWEPACRKVFPIVEGSSIKTLTSGKCAKAGGEFEAPCTLEPGEVSQMRWFGFDIEEGVIRKGITVKPDISISMDYFFLVPNDVVGSMAVQTFQEQLATSTVEKKEKRIINKINRVYSPPGPLMIAMGTAEDQVISTIPTLFLVQFANKGKGVVSELHKEKMKLYLPPDFRPYQSPSGEEICDFETLWHSDPNGDGVITLADLSPIEREKWNPGPGFEDHIIYEPNESLLEIAQTRNPLETPTYFCVLNTPVNVEKVKTYDFKMRVTEYLYTESKRTRLSIMGTALDVTPATTPAGEQTKSFSLGRCPLRTGGWCSSHQTLEFKDESGKNPKEYNVKEITVNARHGGEWGCADSRILITAQNAAGGNVPPPEKLLSDPNAPLGITEPAPSQGRRGITVVFPEAVRIQKVRAASVGHGFGIPCPFIDDVTAVITYTE